MNPGAWIDALFGVLALLCVAWAVWPRCRHHYTLHLVRPSVGALGPSVAFYRCRRCGKYLSMRAHRRVDWVKDMGMPMPPPHPGKAYAKAAEEVADVPYRSVRINSEPTGPRPPAPKGPPPAPPTRYVRDDRRPPPRKQVDTELALAVALAKFNESYAALFPKDDDERDSR